MTDNIRKEELSLSYLNSICAYSGISMEKQHRDDDSLDVVVKKVITRIDGTRYNAQLGIQLKSTSMTLNETDTYISYNLNVKNYNDLRIESTTPNILALLVLPEKEKDWISWNVNELALRKCMYWKCIKNCPNTSNIQAVSIKMPKRNTLSTQSILTLLHKVAEEEEL